MLLSDFHYDLPPELIAQEPLPDRSSSRMLVVDREETLTALTIDAGPVLKMCTGVLAERIHALHRWQGRTASSVDDLAAALARLAQSLVLTPAAPPRLRTHADYERFGRAVIVPMVLG